MKLFHLADLHIGKTVNKFSMLENQKYVFKQILSSIDEHAPDAVLIAGDVYDQTIPSGAAVTLFDDFLTELSEKKVSVLCISGNHDSAERLDFASRIMEDKSIYIAGTFEETPKKVTLTDEHGAINFYLLPFVRPTNVRHFYPDEKIATYEDSMRIILEHTPLDTSQRNVLIAHQFVLPISGELQRSDSEVEPVGGLNCIPAGLFHEFDYVALGHLHGPQHLGGERIRYAGSPLKYSFSETNHKKSITMIELGAKGNISYSAIPLTPLQDMRKIKGPFQEITSKEVLLQADSNDYMHITLTDEEELIDAIGKIRRYYPNVMELSFENSRTRHVSDFSEQLDLEQKNPLALFETFFKEQNGIELSETQSDIVTTLLKEIEEDDQ